MAIKFLIKTALHQALSPLIKDQPDKARRSEDIIYLPTLAEKEILFVAQWGTYIKEHQDPLMSFCGL